MYLINQLPTLPLPVLSLLLPFLAVVSLLSVRVYEIFMSWYRSGPYRVSISIRMLKIFFFLLLLLNVIITVSVWFKFGTEGSALYVLNNSGWSHVLMDNPVTPVIALVQVDALGAMSAVVMGIIAFLAGLRSLADKKNPLSPSKVTFYLLTLLGIQGIFYSNGLFALFMYICLSQIGASCLFNGIPRGRERVMEYVWYYLSRVAVVLMFFIGTMIFYYNYKTDNIALLSTMIKLGTQEKVAYALIVAPLLFLFIKAPSYITDSASRCFFAIRAQAAFFVVFRIVFSLYGPVLGLEKIPLLFIMLGLISLTAAMIFMAGVRDPLKFAESLELFMKGFMLVAMGISVSGTCSAQAASEYGLGAMESMILLWIIFLPASAALSLICCMLKQKVQDTELWMAGGLFRVLPLSGTAFFCVILIIAGLPPFAGYPAKQFLYRSANYLSPVLTLVLFMFSIFFIILAMRYLSVIMFGAGKSRDILPSGGDASIALPVILLLLIFASSTIMPGKIFDSLVSPSADALMNRGQLINTMHRGDSE